MQAASAMSETFSLLGWPCKCFFSWQQMRNEDEQLNMRTNGHVPLRFNYAEGVSFTLPIRKKALHPALFPFSAKKLIGKDAKNEYEPQLPG